MSERYSMPLAYDARPGKQFSPHLNVAIEQRYREAKMSWDYLH
jgi:hypothetical protein